MKATRKQLEKNILANIYDVLANNTNHVSADEIASNFDMEVDFDNNIITLTGLAGEGTVILTAEFIPEGDLD